MKFYYFLTAFLLLSGFLYADPASALKPQLLSDSHVMLHVSADKQKAVFFWWKLETFKNQHLPRIRMAGLDANRMYKVHELNRVDDTPLSCEGKTYSGAYLMQTGLEMPYAHNVDYGKRNDWSSRVLELEAQ